MREYTEGDAAFWHGTQLEQCPYPAEMNRQRSNWRMGWLFAKSVSLLREEENNTPFIAAA